VVLLLGGSQHFNLKPERMAAVATIEELESDTMVKPGQPYFEPSKYRVGVVPKVRRNMAMKALGLS
jgi:hypothetical protein